MTARIIPGVDITASENLEAFGYVQTAEGYWYASTSQVLPPDGGESYKDVIVRENIGKLEQTKVADFLIGQGYRVEYFNDKVYKRSETLSNLQIQTWDQGMTFAEIEQGKWYLTDAEVTEMLPMDANLADDAVAFLREQSDNTGVIYLNDRAFFPQADTFAVKGLSLTPIETQRLKEAFNTISNILMATQQGE